MKKIFSALALLVLFSNGCNWNRSPEELERLVKEDPTFKQMILDRDRAHAQISFIKEDLLKKKQAVDVQVERLRGQYDVYSKAQSRKIEQFRASIDANRARLKNEIDTCEAQAEAKQGEYDGLQKTLADVQKVLKESKGITLSAQEQKKWQERVMMLKEKMRPLAEEMQDLKLRIRLKKQKIDYLD